MPSDVIEPPVDRPEEEKGHRDLPTKGAGKEGASPVPSSSRSTPPGAPVSSSSSDELSLYLAQPRPDPVLGLFAEGEPAASSARPGTVAPAGSFEVASLFSVAAAASDATDPKTRPGSSEASGPFAAGGPVEKEGVSPGSYDKITGLGSLGLPNKSAPTSGSSSEAISTLGLDLSSPAPSPSGRETRRLTEVSALSSPSPKTHDEPEDDDLEGPPARGAPWSTVLLASYASAVTLGLLWVLWTGRHANTGAANEPEPPVPVDTRPDPGQRADRSRRLVPPAPIPAVHTTSLGKPLRMGLIEVTPLEVTNGLVQLQREFGAVKNKPVGQNALRLRLRIKNISPDTVLAPLDEAFVRDRPRADADTFIECGSGGTTIGMYPLAVESELSIVGQVFRDLRPGEEFVTEIVSVPDAAARKTPQMTWRVRLRTDINHTDDLGVRFTDGDVRPVR
jgi:hypothetical protein